MFPVNKCPERLTEVKEASKRIGCGRDKFNNDQYMCIPNEEKTSLVEFCYDGIMGIKEEGKCLTVDTNKHLSSRSCTEFKTGCPSEHFWNYDFFKYPACQDINPVKKCYAQYPSCPPMGIADNTDPAPKGSDLQNSLISVSIVFVGFVIMCIFWPRRKTLQTKETMAFPLTAIPVEAKWTDETEAFPLTALPEEAKWRDETEAFPLTAIVVDAEWTDETEAFPLTALAEEAKWRDDFRKHHLKSMRIMSAFFRTTFELPIKKEQRRMLDDAAIWNGSFYHYPEDVANKENTLCSEQYHSQKTTWTKKSHQVIPDVVKKHLLSDKNVRSFGIWKNLHFKVFVSVKTNENETKDKLTQLDPKFFESHNLEIGQEIVLESLNRKNPDNCKPEDLERKSKITDRHIFVDETTPLQKDDENYKHSIRKLHDDSGTSKQYCLVSDKENTLDKSKNRKKYDGKDDHIVILNKTWTKMLKLNGIIWSAEFYVKGLSNESDTESVFIVLGADVNLPNPNSSVFLVCSRPQKAQQDQIDCVGIICSITVDDISTSETSSKEANATCTREVNKSTGFDKGLREYAYTQDTFSQLERLLIQSMHPTDIKSAKL